MPFAGATVDDLETIVDFNIRLAAESEDTRLDRETVRQGVRGLLADAARGAYYVAGAPGIVGQMMHTHEWSDWRNGDIWWIQSVYVHPDHRRQGVCKALYEHIRERAAADPGVVGVRLYVERENARAQGDLRGAGHAPGRLPGDAGPVRRRRPRRGRMMAGRPRAAPPS